MTARPWTVLSPSSLTQRSERVWTIDDDIPGLNGVNRRMTIVRRADGSLLFYNAVPVPDATLEALRALGSFGALVVPNQFHALDAAAFAQKLNVPAFMPDVAVTALADRVQGRDLAQLPPGDDVRVFTVDGFRTHEAVLVVGKTLIVADLVTNVPHGKGLRALPMRLVGFTGPEPTLPPPVKFRVGVDKPKIRARLEALAGLELDTLIPSHGEVFTGDVSSALRRVARGV